MINFSSKGFLVIISAPSGAGKTTICRQLLKRNPDLIYSISVTTRKPRGKEKNGKSYFFITEEQFKERIEQDYFAEWAIVHGNYYGTPKNFVDEQINRGKLVICDIDVQGGEKIINVYPNAVKIFILPPGWDELESRLRSRRTDSEQVIQKRLNNAKKELKHISHYEYLVINDDLVSTVQKIEKIIEVEKSSIERIADLETQLEKYKEN